MWGSRPSHSEELPIGNQKSGNRVSSRHDSAAIRAQGEKHKRKASHTTFIPRRSPIVKGIQRRNAGELWFDKVNKHAALEATENTVVLWGKAESCLCTQTPPRRMLRPRPGRGEREFPLGVFQNIGLYLLTPQIRGGDPALCLHTHPQIGVHCRPPCKPFRVLPALSMQKVPCTIAYL